MSNNNSAKKWQRDSAEKYHIIITYYNSLDVTMLLSWFLGY